MVVIKHKFQGWTNRPTIRRKTATPVGTDAITVHQGGPAASPGCPRPEPRLRPQDVVGWSYQAIPVTSRVVFARETSPPPAQKNPCSSTKFRAVSLAEGRAGSALVSSV